MSADNRGYRKDTTSCRMLEVVMSPLDTELGFRASAAGMGGVGVSGKLDHVVVLELQRLLESSANLEQNLLALLLCPSLASLTGNGATNGTCPEADTVEASPHVDNDTHDFVVILILEVLADGSQHDVQPKRVDVDCLFIFELEGPLAAVLVL